MRWSTWILGITTWVALAPVVAEAARPVRVVLLADGPSDPHLSLYAKQIRELAADERGFELSLVPEKGRAADGTAAGVRRLFDEVLADKNVELVVTTGPLGSQEALRRKELARPVVAARVLEARPLPNGSSGQKNLTYVLDPGAVSRDLQQLKSLGAPKKVGILVSRSVLEGVEGLGAALEARAKEAGLEGRAVAVEADGAAKLDGLDAAYLLQVDELSQASLQNLARRLSEGRLKSWSSRGRSDVEAGILGALAGPADPLQRARRVAINVLRIAGGEAATTIPVTYQRDEVLILNGATARQIGWEPNFSQTAEAEILGAGPEVAEVGEKVTLKDVVEGALKSNLDLSANLHEVAAAAEDVEKAFSLMLPKVTIGGRVELLDKNRAQASFGLQPQRLGTVYVEANGILFSDKLFANHTIQDRIQAAREGQREALKLDLMLEAAKAYLGVRQAAVLERVRVDNAKKTKANLAQAKVRSSVGTAGPTELLRWESQLALDQREVLQAKSLRSLASMQLNRLMHRPQEDVLRLATETEDQALFALAPERLAPYLETEKRYLAFRELLVAEGIKAAPELVALTAAVEAAERASSAAWRAVFVPTIGYGGQVALRVATGGKGAAPPELPAELPAEQRFLFEQILPPPIGTTTYQLGAFIALPLPFDLDSFADIRKADAEVSRRQAELDSAKEKIEQRIRSAAVAVAASYPGVRLAEESAAAAKKNLVIAQDAYATGALGVLDLLDAQNLTLNAEQLAVAAQYQFMSDQLDLERAVGGFFFMKSAEERNDWLQRISSQLDR